VPATAFGKPVSPVLQPGHPQAQGLVLGLPLSEGGGLTAYDISGRGNNGTLNGGLTWADGPWGRCLSDDGTGYVTTGLLLPETRGAPFTVALLLKGNTDNKLLWSQNQAQGIGLIYNTASPAGLTLSHGAGATLSQAWSVVLDGNWHHIAVVFPDGWVGTNNCLIYLDGAPLAQVAGPNGVSGTTGSNFTPGGRTIGSACWVGSLDGFFVATRALPAAEAAALSADPFAAYRRRSRRLRAAGDAAGPAVAGNYGTFPKAMLRPVA
jgi:hypothetical protein